MFSSTVSNRGIPTLFWLACIVGFFAVSRVNYLLFHSMVELFSTIVACGVFMIAWNTRRLQENGFFLFLGIAALCIACIDFLHLLAYKKMGVFPAADANLPTQLWVAARYLQSVTLCLAPLFIRRKASAPLLFAGLGGATALLLLAIFQWHVFPACFVEGSGLTPFKIMSEYLIALLMLLSMALIRRQREEFDPHVLNQLIWAIACFIAAEMAFTLYTDVFGISNAIGHLLKVAGFYCIYRGVVETGLARPYDLLFRKLKQSEERYRHLYKETPVMLHSIDREGRLVNMSSYWLKTLGYDEEEISGLKWVDFLTPESRLYAEETVIPEFFQTGLVQDVPYQLRKKGGEIIDVLLTATAERDATGEVLRSLAVMVDVTERNEAQQKITALVSNLAALNNELEDTNEELAATNEELATANEELANTNLELEHANRDLEAFNYTVSHDLRTPLTNIDGFCQLLQTLYREKLDTQSLEFIENIHDEARRMNALISTLLRFARIGQVELQRTSVNVSDMAQSIALNYAMHEPDRQARVTIAEEIAVEADPALVRIALENLIGNAWKYTGKTEIPRIEVGATDVGGRLVCFVRDNGTGFDMNQADKLFNPFQRLHDKREFEGHGIGLATVQRIVQRHGGKIWAESEVGKGATFYFHF